MKTPQFDHEKLNVYQRALEFVAAATDLLDQIPKRSAVHNQLDRASTAIPLNIAEGSGKWTAPDRCRFYDIARGSALECAAALDVAVVKKALRAEEITDAKQVLVAIVSMLIGLIKSVSPDRTYQAPEGGTRSGRDQRQGAGPSERYDKQRFGGDYGDK